ncbi:MAG: M3 family metallopeptidase, partial [Rickettsiales bacterium]|nr:M3 family metallopeptidase [Rickettsiales bacterium]
MLGNFNLKALENAEQRILDIIATARAKTEELVKIDNKTYMNFVRPLMDLDIEIKKVYAPVNHLDMVNNSDETKKIIEATLPTMSDYSSDMSRHKGIYEGILEIKKKEYNSLTIAQKRVLDESIKGFEIAGIALPKDQQKRLKEISAEIAKLSNDFSNNVIESNKKNKIKVTDEAILGEMPQSDRDSAKIEDGWEFSMLAPSFGPFMDYVTDRNLREQMYKNYTTRAPENEQIIPQILALRDEEAKILGFKNYAELALQFRDAKVPERAHQYLLNLVNIAKPFAEKDMADLKEYAGFDLQPWDYSFYSRKLQKEKYDLDESEIKPYFEGDATMRGMLEIASEMFGI